MRNISFALTTEQVRNRTKTVTRRTGWENLKAGTLLCAVVKGMGLKKGEKVERLCTIRVLSVTREPLIAMLRDFGYGSAECAREGFPLMLPGEFADFFMKSHACSVHDDLTRIEFEYVSESESVASPRLSSPAPRGNQFAADSPQTPPEAVK